MISSKHVSPRHKDMLEDPAPADRDPRARREPAALCWGSGAAASQMTSTARSMKIAYLRPKARRCPAAELRGPTAALLHGEGPQCV